MRIPTAVALLLLPAVAHAQSVVIGSGASEKIYAGGQLVVSSDGVEVQSGGGLTLSGTSADAQAVLQGATTGAPLGSPITVQSEGTIILKFAMLENITTLTVASGGKVIRIDDTVFLNHADLNPGATPWIDLSAAAVTDRQNLPFSFNRVGFWDQQGTPTRKNVKAGANTPIVRLLGNPASHGNRWGESYEDDPYNRVFFHTGAISRTNPVGTFDTLADAIADASTTADSILSVGLGPNAFIRDYIDWNQCANSSANGPIVMNACLASMGATVIEDTDAGTAPRGKLVNCVVARGSVKETYADNCTFFDPAGTISVSYVTGRNVLVQNAYTGGGNSFTTSLTSATSSFFHDSANYDFHLCDGGGAAIDAGAVLDFQYDFEGQARSTGVTWDIGADEAVRPIPTIINDGEYPPDIVWQDSTTTIRANWTAFGGCVITGYEWAIGTDASTEVGRTNIQGFTSIGIYDLEAANYALSLTRGTTCYVTVRASNAVGLTAWAVSNGVTPVTAAPAAAPANFSGTVESDYSIAWTWDAVDHATFYEVHDDDHNVVWESTTNSCTEYCPYENTAYSRHVHAVNFLGTSAASPTASPRTTVHDPDQYDFWVDPCVSMAMVTVFPPLNETDGSTGVKIERWDGIAEHQWQMVRDFDHVYEFNDPNLTAGTWYYRITFRNADEVVTAVSPDNSVTIGEQPAPPTDLVAVGGAGSIGLSWTAGTESFLAGYNVYRSETSGTGYSKINGSVATGRTYTDGTATANTKYYYVVKAVSMCSVESGPSNEDSATAGAADGLPPPTNLKVISYYGANHLHWDAVAGAVGYRIYRNGSLLTPVGQLVPINEYRDNAVTNGQTYTYKVQAVK